MDGSLVEAKAEHEELDEDREKQEWYRNGEEWRKEQEGGLEH